MPRFLKHINLAVITILMGTTLVVDGAIPASSMASPATVMARSPRQRLNFRLGVRPSNRRIGGYSRGAMCDGEQSLTSLVPPPQSQEEISENQVTVDKTASGHPTFFVNVSSLPSTTGMFTLRHEIGNVKLYSVTFQLTGQSGIVGITIPDTVPALQVGQKYFWQVRVPCDLADPTIAVTVRNWVERTALVDSPRSTPDDQLTTLAEQGIWQDVLTILALQRYRNPQDPLAVQDWANLMEAAGLPQFKSTPIIQMVNYSDP